MTKVEVITATIALRRWVRSRTKRHGPPSDDNIQTKLLKQYPSFKPHEYRYILKHCR